MLLPNTTQECLSEYTIPKDGSEFRSIQTPLCSSIDSRNLLIWRSNGQFSTFDLYNKKETIIQCTPKWKVIKVIDLSDDFFLTMNIVETSPEAQSIQIELQGKTIPFSEIIIIKQVPTRSDQVKHLRIEVLEEKDQRQKNSCCFIIYVLEKMDELILADNQNQFALHIMAAKLSKSKAQLLQVRKVEFSATLRAFEIVPLWNAGCLLYSAQHSTTRIFQFLLWDQNGIQVHQTDQALKGTVVSIMALRMNLELKEATHVLMFYNTNGTKYPNVLKYNLDSKEEIHKPIQTQEECYIIDSVLPHLVNERLCFINVNNLVNSNLLIYDIIDFTVIQQIPGFDAGSCILGVSFFIIIEHTIESQCAKLRLYHKNSGMLTSLHYLLSIFNGGKRAQNEQSIIEEVFQMYEKLDNI